MTTIEMGGDLDTLRRCARRRPGTLIYPTPSIREDPRTGVTSPGFIDWACGCRVDVKITHAISIRCGLHGGTIGLPMIASRGAPAEYRCGCAVEFGGNETGSGALVYRCFACGAA